MATFIAQAVSKIKLPQPLLVRVTYVRSAEHNVSKKKGTLKALGLHHLHQSKVHKNIRPVRGMIQQVKEFITVEPINVVAANQLEQVAATTTTKVASESL